MIYRSLQQRLPASVRNYVLFFEASIERSVADFARKLPAAARVLDAGAGESQYADRFDAHRYIAVDLAVGDARWNYRRLDAIADLTALPFAASLFDGVINVVTLEHVNQPAQALAEMARVLTPSGLLLLIVPHEWEVHQMPHDYFRYTRYGLQYLLQSAGLEPLSIDPVGGYFRLMSRRLLNGLQFFSGLWIVPAAVVLAPLALIMPLFDKLDPERNFTLGYICLAKRRS